MNNTCTDQYSGADFGCGEGWDGVVNSTHFEHCYSLSTGIRSFVCTAGFRPCTAGYEADFIRAPTYSTIHVAQPARASGGDTPHCGELGSECATIAHALTRLAPPAPPAPPAPDASDAPQPIAVLPGSYQEPGVAVAQTHIRISSKDPASPAEVRCNTTGAVLFATASGALELAQLVLVADWGVCPATPLLVLDGDEGAVAVAECTITGAGHSAANRFRSPVVVLHRGAGRITRCTVTALVLDSASAIWVGRRCTAAVECTVCAHIVRSSGCGGAIVLEEEEDVEEDGDSIASASASANTNEGDAAQAISGCVFEDCCAEGDGSGGGAICARLRGRGCFTVNASASSGCTLPLVRHHSHNSNTTRASHGTNGGDDGSGGEALFSRCKSSGYGGAVYLDLAEGFGTLLLDGVVFGGCEAALGGANVFVNGCALTPAKISTSTFCFPFDQSSADDLMGVDRALPEVAPFTLAVFLVPFPGAAHVAGQPSRASNTPFCGFSFFPCLTIPHAARTRFPAADPAILLDEGFQLCERLAADAHAWSISCVRKGMEVPVGAPPGFSSPSLVAVSTEAAIADIRFAVPASLGSATALVEVAGAGSLRMASCSAVHKHDGATAPGDGSEEQLTFALIAVRSGRLVLSEFETLGEVANTMFSLMECTGSSSVVECSGCVIGGGEKGSGDGGCVKMAGVGGGSARLEMENCTVARCSARGSEARGGGVAAELAAGAVLLINGSTFEDCAAAAAAAAAGGGQAQTRGLGGAVFVGEADAARLFALEHVVFARCDAWKGRKVFVSATVLSAVADAAHFNWAMTSADLSTLDELGGFELATADPSRPIPLAASTSVHAGTLLLPA
ncbi:uncharacterized protein MONOS_17834 [Monocercomonoides exilis]|uniref:uncharacterized protein n=1 Tax=Monocercomonoides exilis TaxID=2049356 RepID=UPI00355A2007|nr:hypothetical protein MONOS_17834 [Monocercomonoides exilis]